MEEASGPGDRASAESIRHDLVETLSTICNFAALIEQALERLTAEPAIAPDDPRLGQMADDARAVREAACQALDVLDFYGGGEPGASPPPP